MTQHNCSIKTVANIVIFLLLAMEWVAIFGGHRGEDLKRIVTSLPAVQLSSSERATFAEALVSYTSGDQKPINTWVAKLEKAKRYGILPALPEKYSHPAIVRWHYKWVLCKRLL